MHHTLNSKVRGEPLDLEGTAPKTACLSPTGHPTSYSLFPSLHTLTTLLDSQASEISKVEADSHFIGKEMSTWKERKITREGPRHLIQGQLILGTACRHHLRAPCLTCAELILLEIQKGP